MGSTVLEIYHGSSSCWSPAEVAVVLAAHWPHSNPWDPYQDDLPAGEQCSMPLQCVRREMQS